jgi:HSP20 family protein
MAEEMDDLFELFRDGEGMRRGPHFVPRTNFAETEGEYEVTVDLPGLKPEEVTVEVKDGNLWISGKREEEKEEKGKTYHRVERRYGEFRRVLTLPGPVDREKVVAKFENGVLRIAVPKKEEAKPKRIEVTT